MRLFASSMTIAALAPACRPREFHQSLPNEAATEDASWLVNPAEMEEAGVFQTYRQLFMGLGALEDAKIVASRLGITSAGKRQRWIFLATVPLQASRKSFLERGGILWSNSTESYRTFATVTMAVSAREACTQTPLSPMESYPPEFATDSATHREITCLRAIHSALGYSGVLRPSVTLGRMVDGNPLMPAEIEAVRAMAADGFIKPLELIRNAAGETVPIWTIPESQRTGGVVATGIEYPEGPRVQGLLEKWDADGRALDGQTGADLVAGIARLTRQCISIHPFNDANGRTCRAWMARQFLVRGVPSPLMWSDQDILLTNDEWTRRVVKAVEVHTQAIATL